MRNAALPFEIIGMVFEFNNETRLRGVSKSIPFKPTVGCFTTPHTGTLNNLLQKYRCGKWRVRGVVIDLEKDEKANFQYDGFELTLEKDATTGFWSTVLEERSAGQFRRPFV